MHLDKVKDLIQVTVTADYEGKTKIHGEKFILWKYKIVIFNSSEGRVQILNRHWKIVDSNGFVREVRGEGIVGEQPVIKPQGRFEYSSYAHLKNHSGLMYGKYMALNMENNDVFEATIPAFSLDSPQEITLLN